MMVVLMDPIRSQLETYATNAALNAAAAAALENNSQGMGENQPPPPQDDSPPPKRLRVDDAGKGEDKQHFKDLNGVWRYCADKRNGKKLIRRLSGLYRLWPSEDIDKYLVDGEFNAQEVLDTKLEENILREEGDQSPGQESINFEFLRHMGIVKDPNKFNNYMLHLWTINDRSVVCLDDFTRDGKPLPVLQEVSSAYREQLGKALMGLSYFEGFYRSTRVARVWASFAVKVEQDVKSPFKYVGCEILTTAIEFEWMKWQREVYTSTSSEWFTEQTCANNLDQRLQCLLDTFSQGIHEGSRYSMRAFYGEGGMWHHLKGRKTGQDKALVHSQKPQPKESTAPQERSSSNKSPPCLKFAASILKLAFADGTGITCHQGTCPHPHPPSLDNAGAAKALYASDLSPAMALAMEKWSNK